MEYHNIMAMIKEQMKKPENEKLFMMISKWVIETNDVQKCLSSKIDILINSRDPRKESTKWQMHDINTIDELIVAVKAVHEFIVRCSANWKAHHSEISSWLNDIYKIYIGAWQHDEVQFNKLQSMIEVGLIICSIAQTIGNEKDIVWLTVPLHRILHDVIIIIASSFKHSVGWGPLKPELATILGNFVQHCLTLPKTETSAFKTVHLHIMLLTSMISSPHTEITQSIARFILSTSASPFNKNIRLNASHGFQRGLMKSYGMCNYADSNDILSMFDAITPVISSTVLFSDTYTIPLMKASQSLAVVQDNPLFTTRYADHLFKLCLTSLETLRSLQHETDMVVATKKYNSCISLIRYCLLGNGTVFGISSILQQVSHYTPSAVTHQTSSIQVVAQFLRSGSTLARIVSNKVTEVSSQLLQSLNKISESELHKIRDIVYTMLPKGVQHDDHSLKRSNSHDVETALSSAKKISNGINSFLEGFLTMENHLNAIKNSLDVLMSYGKVLRLNAVDSHLEGIAQQLHRKHFLFVNYSGKSSGSGHGVEHIQFEDILQDARKELHSLHIPTDLSWAIRNNTSGYKTHLFQEINDIQRSIVNEIVEPIRKHDHSVHNNCSVAFVDCLDALAPIYTKYMEDLEPHHPMHPHHGYTATPSDSKYDQQSTKPNHVLSHFHKSKWVGAHQPQDAVHHLHDCCSQFASHMMKTFTRLRNICELFVQKIIALEDTLSGCHVFGLSKDLDTFISNFKPVCDIVSDMIQTLDAMFKFNKYITFLCEQHSYELLWDKLLEMDNKLYQIMSNFSSNKSYKSSLIDIDLHALVTAFQSNSTQFPTNGVADLHKFHSYFHSKSKTNSNFHAALEQHAPDSERDCFSWLEVTMKSQIERIGNHLKELIHDFKNRVLSNLLQNHQLKDSHLDPRSRHSSQLSQNEVPSEESCISFLLLHIMRQIVVDTNHIFSTLREDMTSKSAVSISSVLQNLEHFKNSEFNEKFQNKSNGLNSGYSESYSLNSCLNAVYSLGEHFEELHQSLKKPALFLRLSATILYMFENHLYKLSTNESNLISKIVSDYENLDQILFAQEYLSPYQSTVLDALIHSNNTMGWWSEIGLLWKHFGEDTNGMTMIQKRALSLHDVVVTDTIVEETCITALLEIGYNIFMTVNSVGGDPHLSDLLKEVFAQIALKYFEYGSDASISKVFSQARYHGVVETSLKDCWNVVTVKILKDLNEQYDQQSSIETTLHATVMKNQLTAGEMKTIGSSMVHIVGSNMIIEKIDGVVSLLESTEKIFNMNGKSSSAMKRELQSLRGQVLSSHHVVHKTLMKVGHMNNPNLSKESGRHYDVYPYKSRQQDSLFTQEQGDGLTNSMQSISKLLPKISDLLHDVLNKLNHIETAASEALSIRHHQPPPSHPQASGKLPTLDYLAFTPKDSGSAIKTPTTFEVNFSRKKALIMTDNAQTLNDYFTEHFSAVNSQLGWITQSLNELTTSVGKQSMLSVNPSGTANIAELFDTRINNHREGLESELSRIVQMFQSFQKSFNGNGKEFQAVHNELHRVHTGIEKLFDLIDQHSRSSSKNHISDHPEHLDRSDTMIADKLDNHFHGMNRDNDRLHKILIKILENTEKNLEGRHPHGPHGGAKPPGTGPLFDTPSTQRPSSASKISSQKNKAGWDKSKRFFNSPDEELLAKEHMEAGMPHKLREGVKNFRDPVKEALKQVFATAEVVPEGQFTPEKFYR